ncbi:MAG: hypothetical protein ACP5F1_03525 [Thermoplasmata archaeon]|nr:hypothetical protein [Thermoplasmata archaeon]
MKSAIREYDGKNLNLNRLADKVQEFFNKQKFKVQRASHPKGILIQAQKEGILRTIFAADQAITVIISGEPNHVVVRMGVAKWLQDLGIAAIESFIISPLLLFIEVPESLWIFEIERELWKYIEEQINSGL